MSVEAISWALNLAPIPVDASGKRNPACKVVLVGLANHAGPDGRDAFPSVRTLVRYTDLSERTVRTALDRLATAGIIRPSDPAIIAAKIKRAGYRPQGWDLAMNLIRDDLTDEDLVALESQFPGLTQRVAQTRTAPTCTAAQPVPDEGGQPGPGNETTQNRPVDNQAGAAGAGVQLLHLSTIQGCNHRMAGVQPPPGRGAVAAPEPPQEPSVEPSTTRVPGGTGGPATGTDALAVAAGTAEFFAALPAAWVLSPGQRAWLAPLVVSALSAGWIPAELAGAVGANATGVRSPYAVLATRLAPGDLPPPPRRAGARRRAWCGICDPRTRRLELPDGSDGGRCPHCHPGPAASCTATPPRRPGQRREVTEGAASWR